MESKCMHKATVVLRGMTCFFNIKHPIHCFLNVVKCNGTCSPCAMNKISTMKMVQKIELVSIR